MKKEITEQSIILCENIGLLRKSFGLSQKEMAQICGIGVSSLRKIEKEKIIPDISVEIIFLLSRHFNLPPKRFFTPLNEKDFKN